MAQDQNGHVRRYSVGEEIFSSVTHGVGALLSIVGLVMLIVLAALYGDAWHIVSFSIFGGTLIVLYAASTLYHSFSNPSAKMILRKIDHSAIYLLIAGTYTPFVLVSIRGAWGWSIFGVIWTLAIIGITTKFVAAHRFRGASVAIYLVMGWLGVIVIRQMLSGVPPHSLILLLIGGLSYTTGVIFYRFRRLPFNHGIWHLFVLCGSASHYFSILGILKDS